VFEEIHPRFFVALHLQFQGCLDLRHFCFDEQGIAVPLSVILDEDIEGFLMSISADKISWRLGT
jgi:hypothetical protein